MKRGAAPAAPLLGPRSWCGRPSTDSAFVAPGEAMLSTDSARLAPKESMLAADSTLLAPKESMLATDSTLLAARGVKFLGGGGW
jgi:hypothetical protein